MQMGDGGSATAAASAAAAAVITCAFCSTGFWCVVVLRSPATERGLQSANTRFVRPSCSSSAAPSRLRWSSSERAPSCPKLAG